MIFLALATATFILLYLGAQWLDLNSQKPEPRGDHTQRYAYETLTELNGVTYRQRRDVTTVLLMGIDTTASKQATAGYRNGGQADFLRLIVIDDTNKQISQIQIDRDTMTPITVLGIMGNKSGVRTAQISLSHGFGDGLVQSCELTAEAVSNLFFGIPIDYYVAMNLDGIPVMNDLLGGITVTLEDDFTALDPAMTKGSTLTLSGSQAEHFVRGRMDIGTGTNEARMERQELYLSQLLGLLFSQAGSSKEFIGTLYDQLLPYLTTNLNRGKMINTVWAAKDYQHTEILQPIGSHQIGADGFMQFWIDEAALQQSVIDMFYKKVK